MSCIASSIPGRIRLRHAALRNPGHLARLGETIGQWAHIHAVFPNARAGSLLVSYDAVALAESDCARRCEDAMQAFLPAPAAKTEAAPARPDKRGGGSPRVRANRVAKRGMLASLAASMALAAVGAKRWHIGTGLVFLHALGVHLWVHRNNLLR